MLAAHKSDKSMRAARLRLGAAKFGMFGIMRLHGRRASYRTGRGALAGLRHRPESLLRQAPMTAVGARQRQLFAEPGPAVIKDGAIAGFLLRAATVCRMVRSAPLTLRSES